ncbi:hypothetical protein [Escherichia coli]|uniref:hypothetical protein n=1 Tax=Escherichia coli TaxID=562 RepID=UPI0022263F91|nr:hypothetical protein [Escherichia coli]MCW3365103.1 hypothetical protein [Escherichia coli]
MTTRASYGAVSAWVRGAVRRNPGLTIEGTDGVKGGEADYQNLTEGEIRASGGGDAVLNGRHPFRNITRLPVTLQAERAVD